MKRIPGLDGLRAISILLVVVGHLSGTRGFILNGTEDRFGDLANLGVRAFFVISGYLITLLLIREFERNKTISIRQFYIRRTLRIFPASYTFVLFVTVASYLGVFALHRYDLLHAYTYTMNYAEDRSWWVGHLWSLSVEEQFYLLWPATLLILGLRKGLRVAIGVVLSAPLLRIATSYLWVSQRPMIGNTFQTIADTIATGCILAGYKDDLLRQRWFRKIIDSRLFFLVPLAAIVLNAKAGGRIRWLVLETAINVLIALCVCRVTMHTEDWAGKILNWGPVAYVGVLSYSLYLWQQLFINRNSGAWTERFPQNLLLAVCAAMLCHYLIERPFLGLRDARRSKVPEPNPLVSEPVAQIVRSELPAGS
jgi:peptidoglycan/LPS O-acetylase OafA/YrhL